MIKIWSHWYEREWLQSPSAEEEVLKVTKGVDDKAPRQDGITIELLIHQLIYSPEIEN